MKIFRYELSKDGKGLRGYFRKAEHIHFYHIHSNELSPLEKWIHKILLEMDYYKKKK